MHSDHNPTCAAIKFSRNPNMGVSNSYQDSLFRRKSKEIGQQGKLELQCLIKNSNKNLPFQSNETTIALFLEVRDKQ